MNNSSYTKLFNTRKESFWIENNIIFKIYNKMLVPEYPIINDSTITKEGAKKLLKETKAILIRTMSDYDCGKEQSEWYAMVCDEFTPIEKMSSKYRYEINKGLKNGVVRKISCEELANDGYDCYKTAMLNYKNSNLSLLSENEYKSNILTSQGLDDICHFWGIYSSDKLIAYGVVYIYGEESSYTVFKANPDFQKQFPMYALIYKMNEYYLDKKKFKYIKSGFRSLLHDTSVQDFLIKKFGFRKVYLKLHIHYNPLFGILMKLTFPFRKIIAKFDARFKALFELERIHRKSNR